ncbi:MAG: mismatch-specific DNA-glycosylase [Dehalococcoidia bacterium]|nr:mismatch-specific DNA-glycosylase [Dehalococcoidia bacterium]
MATALHTLPDLLRPGLDLVFVGINPGERSAARGHYYGHPGNAFWRVLSASPLIARAVTPEDAAALAQAHPLRIGFTDVVKRVLTDSTGITDLELREAAFAFRARIAASRPRTVCFTSTRSFAAIYPVVWRARAWGRQPVPPLEGAEVWVRPSPSGRAAAYHGETTGVLASLAAALRGSRSEPEPIPPPSSRGGKRGEMLGVEPPVAPGRATPRRRARA